MNNRALLALSLAPLLGASQNLLQANPDVSLIFAQADGLALGAAQAVKVSGVSQRVYVGGFDGETAEGHAFGIDKVPLGLHCLLLGEERFHGKRG